MLVARALSVTAVEIKQKQMDRELSKEVIRERKTRTALRIGVPVIVFAVFMAILPSLLRKTVRKSDLDFATVERGELSLTYPASGTVAPAFEEIVNSPVSSRILEVYHKSGDVVEAGEPLLKLDLQSAETDLRKAESEAEIKRLEIEKMKLSNRTELNDMKMKIEVSRMNLSKLAAELRGERYLDSLGSGTADKVREVEFSYKTAELELKQLEEGYTNRQQTIEADIAVEQLQYDILCGNLEEMRRTFQGAQILSPRKAYLTYINSEIGAQVAKDTKIATVADLEHFKITGSISELYASHILVGSRAVISSGSNSLGATVSNVNPLSRNGSIEFTILPDDDSAAMFRSGLKVDVDIEGDLKESVLMVKKGPYYSKEGEYNLFVLDGENKLVKKNVRLGEAGKDAVEVISGLSEGDRIVTNNMESYKKTNKIKIK